MRHPFSLNTIIDVFSVIFIHMKAAVKIVFAHNLIFLWENTEDFSGSNTYSAFQALYRFIQRSTKAINADGNETLRPRSTRYLNWIGLEKSNSAY